MADETFHALLHMVPGLKDPVQLGLFAHKHFSRATHTSVDNGGNAYTRVIVSNRVLARLSGRGGERKHRGYLDVLERHKELFPHFELTGYKPGEYPRQVRHHGTPQGVLDLLLADLRKPLSEL